MNDIRRAQADAKNLYGVDIKNDEFEELALMAWEEIGNKHTRLYRVRADLNKKLEVELPCNCDLIEAVTYGWEDPQLSSNIHEPNDPYKTHVEQYIEHRKPFKDPYYQSGRFVKYTRSGDTLYFDRNYGPITILYHGIILGDDDLPMVNEKETRAIACFCAYYSLFKKGLATMNPNIIAMADRIKAEWAKRCASAKTPEYIDLNMMNEILDAKASWDRKVYNKSLKPIK